MGRNTLFLTIIQRGILCLSARSAYTLITVTVSLSVAVSLSVLLALAALPDTAQAQSLDFKRYSVPHGIPHAYVTGVHQTDDGYIWLATGGGLARFDGRQVKTYNTDHGLRDEMVNLLFEDSGGNLWVPTYTGGVATFEQDSLVYPFEGLPIDEEYIMSIHESPDGSILFTAFDSGIYIYSEGEFDVMGSDDGLIHPSVWDIWWNQEQDETWYATHGGVTIYDGETFRHLTTEDGLSGEKVFRIVDAGPDGVWLATNRGVTIYRDGELTAITEIKGRQLHYVFDMIRTSDGTIWIGMENDGIFRYDGSEFEHLTRRDGLGSHYIYGFYEDLDHNVWIATMDNGAQIYRGDAFSFINSRTGLNSDEVLSVHIDADGVKWIGTDRGLNSWDGGEFRSYPIPGIEDQIENIWDIVELQNGNLLLLLEDSRIMEFDGESFRSFSDLYTGLDELYIYDLFVDSEGRLWIGADTGLYRADSEDEVERFTLEDGLAGNVVYHLYEADDGSIWVGTIEGVSRVMGSDVQSIRVEDGLGHHSVNYILQDRFGDFWFGTGGGVTWYRPGGDETAEDDAADGGAADDDVGEGDAGEDDAGEGDAGEGEIRNFGRSDGMAFVETLSLQFDENDQLWQGTNGGIQRLDVDNFWQTGEMDIVQYQLSHRDIGIEMTHKAVATSPNCLLLFGTMQGLVQIDPAKVDRASEPPRIGIETILLNGVPLSWSDYSDNLEFRHGTLQLPPVEFSYGENTWNFAFSSREFLTPESVEYRYKLRGFDTQWRAVTRERTAAYTRLSPGDYEFLVQARVKQGPWSPEVSYTFSVLAPFWLTGWFWGLVILVVSALVVGFIRIRLQILEKGKLQKLVDEKTEELQRALKEKEVLLKEVHHRVKNNLAVIYGLLDLQMGTLKDEESKSQLKESQLRVKSIALIHEKIYGHQSLAHIDLRKYLDDLIEAIVGSIQSDSTDVVIRTDVDPIHLSLDYSVPCGLILNELITNAYQHAFNGRKGGELKIKLKEAGRWIELVVADNGNGLPEEYRVEDSNSLGLVLVDALTEQLEGNLHIDSNKNGTSFRVKFPLKRNVEKGSEKQ